MRGAPRVAVVGSLACDRIGGGPPQPGGGPTFAALAFRVHGSGGQILARCAAGDESFFAQSLDHLGVAVTVLPSRATYGFDHDYEGESRTSRITQIGDPWTAEAARHLAPTVAWVHLAPLSRSDFRAETLAAFAAGSRRLLFDGQGLVRASHVGPLEENATFDPAVMAHVSVLKLSEGEARIVAGGELSGTTVRALGVPEVLQTLGSRGAVVWVEGEPTHVPTTPVLGVETTGAGDVFMVGYAIARSAGTPPLEAAREASALVGRVLAERKLTATA